MNLNKNMTNLQKVSERVNALSQNCHDKLIPVEDISFDSLQTVKISNERHLLRPLAQQAIALETRDTDPLSQEMPI